MDSMHIDDARYLAVLANDARFDGQFFVGVLSTGIFCRVVCSARKPLRRNVVFHPSAAAAFEAGLRPCLRCRPELAPERARTTGKADVVTRAIRWIDDGLLDHSSITELAARVGVTDRHLRRLFDEQLGASPTAVSQTRRLLFAKQLIERSDLSFTHTALAAGYQSLRRFNHAIQSAYARTPTQLRQGAGRRKPAVPVPERPSDAAPNAFALRLGYLGEYDWSAMLAYLRGRAFPGVEAVDASTWRRAFVIDGSPGWVEVEHRGADRALDVRIRLARVACAAEAVRSIRDVFDLDANLPRIAEHLRDDDVLGASVRARPGLRVPGAWSAFEIAMRAILGQQVSVAAATTMAARIVTQWGEPLDWRDLQAPVGLTHAFPGLDVLAQAPLERVGIIGQRAHAIRSLARRLIEEPEFFDRLNGLDAAVRALCELPGIGPWTAHYIAMRALREPDAFPAADLGVRKALEPLGVRGERAALAHAKRWRPWRAYALMHLWHLPIAYQPRKSS